MPDEQNNGETTDNQEEPEGQQPEDNSGEVAALKARLSALSTVNDKLKGAAQQVSLEPEAFVDHASKAFTILSDLVSKGVLDTTGELRVDPNRSPEHGYDHSPAGDYQSPSEPAQHQDSTITELKNVIAGLTGQVNDMMTVTNNLMRKDLITTVQTEHPDLDRSDILALIAKRDTTRPILDQAKELATEQIGKVQQIEERFAKKAGLDYAAVVNRLTEQQNASGSPIPSKTKVAFDAKSRGTGYITPQEAIELYLQAKKG